jgi:hypothetical protein
LDQSYEVQSIVFVENRIVAVIYRNGKKAFLRALAYDSLRKESSHWLDVGRNFDVPLEIWPHGKYPVFTCFECYKASSLGFDREGIADIYITTQVNRILDGSTAAATPNGSLVAGTKRGFILFLLRQGFVGSQQLDAGPVHAIAALDEARAFGVGREGIYYAYVSPGLSQILPWSKGTVKSVKLGYSVESDKTGGPDQRRLLAASENFLAYGTSERLDFGVLSWAWQFTTAGIFYITLISAVFSLVGLFVGSIFDKRAVG